MFPNTCFQAKDTSAQANLTRFDSNGHSMPSPALPQPRGFRKRPDYKSATMAMIDKKRSSKMSKSNDIPGSCFVIDLTSCDDAEGMKALPEQNTSRSVENWILHDPNSFEITVFLFSLALVHKHDLSMEHVPIECRNDANGAHSSFVVAFSKLPHVTTLSSFIKDGLSLEDELDKIDARFYVLFTYLGSDQFVRLHTKEDFLSKCPRLQVWPEYPEEHAKSASFDKLRQQHGSFYAFHGSAVDNYWSILQTGLRNLSTTKYQAHGAVAGNGIYMSPSAKYASQYCQRKIKRNFLTASQQIPPGFTTFNQPPGRVSGQPNSAFPQTSPNLSQVNDNPNFSPWTACTLQPNNLNIIAILEVACERSSLVTVENSRIVVNNEDAVIVRGLMVWSENTTSPHRLGNPDLVDSIEECLPKELVGNQVPLAEIVKLRDRNSRGRFLSYNACLANRSRSGFRDDRNTYNPNLPLDQKSFDTIEEALLRPKPYLVYSVTQGNLGVEIELRDVDNSIYILVVGQHITCSCCGQVVSTEVCSHQAHVMINMLHFDVGNHIELTWQKLLDKGQYKTLSTAVSKNLKSTTQPGSKLSLPPFDETQVSLEDRRRRKWKLPQLSKDEFSHFWFQKYNEYPIPRQTRKFLLEAQSKSSASPTFVDIAKRYNLFEPLVARAYFRHLSITST